MYSSAPNESTSVQVNASTPCQKEQTQLEYDPCSPGNSIVCSTLGRQYSFLESNVIFAGRSVCRGKQQVCDATSTS